MVKREFKNNLKTHLRSKKA